MSRELAQDASCKGATTVKLRDRELFAIGRVEINTATGAELTRLRGIGPRLADRIVSAREAGGPFHGPTDLARVGGISGEHARELDPQIDWHVPADVSVAIERDWFTASYLMLAGIPLIWGMLESYSRLREWLTGEEVDGSAIQTWIWISILTIEAAAFCAFVVFGAAEGLTRRPQRAHIFRVSRLGAIMLAALGFLSLAAGNLVWYETYAPGGWDDLTSNTSAVAGLVTGIGFFAMWVFPIVALLWKPALVQQRAFAIAVDVVFLVYSLAIAWSVWAFREDVPLAILTFLGINAALNGVFALFVLTRQTSILEVLTAFAVTLRSDRIDSTNRWTEWVNRSLPNPEEQLELKRTLDKIYPASRTRTLGASVVVAVGLAVVGAVSKSLVQALFEGVGVT